MASLHNGSSIFNICCSVASQVVINSSTVYYHDTDGCVQLRAPRSCEVASCVLIKVSSAGS